MLTPTINPNKAHFHFLIGMLALIITGLILHATMNNYHILQLVDEYPHYMQVQWFMDGNFAQVPALTTIPGYHAVMALFGKFLNLSNLSHVRLMSLLIAFATVAVFYLCLRKTAPEVALPRSLAFFFLPVMFPYNFLVYTHGISMLMLLLGFYFYLGKQIWLCALFMALSIFIRQTNIIWVCALTAMFYIDLYIERDRLPKVGPLIKNHFPFILIFIAFAVFLVKNGGVAIGDAQSHPMGLTVGNLYFYMFCFTVIFLPLIVMNFSSYRDKFKQHAIVSIHVQRKRYRIPVYTWMIALTMFVLFLLLFKVTHPYNFVPGFIHNVVPNYFNSSLGLKLTWIIPIFATVLSAFVLKLSRPSAYVLYFFSLMVLVLHPLIEHRYYIPIMAFLLMFMKPQKKSLEWFQLGYFIALSGLLVWLKFAMQLFP